MDSAKKVKIQSNQDYHQKHCDHDYEQVYQGSDSESYECKKCRDRYKLYYEDML